MPEDLRVTNRVVIPANELVEQFSRSSGPGGQKVNTTDSRVELRFDVQRSSALPEQLRERVVERLGKRLVDGVLTVTASQHRSQLHNRRAVREQLAKTLAAALAPPPKTRRPTKPSRAANQRRLGSKKHRGVIKSRRRRGDPGEA
jgi:ribosome-associated protein